MSSGEKTEQPTPKKQNDARKKGQVAQSKDVSSTAILIAAFAYLFIGGNWIFENLQELVSYPGQLMHNPLPEVIPVMISFTFYKIMLITVPFLGIVVITGVATNFFTVGPLFVIEPLKPDLKKLDPVQKAKQIFSMKNLFEFGKSIIKVTFLGFLIYLVIKNAIPNLLQIPHSGVEGVLEILSNLLFEVAKYTVFANIVIAFADFMFQRWQHNKQLMMTKDEVKQEYKEMEGDPTIKSKRKQLHQEMVMSNNMEGVRKSSVLVTNPTHKAIGLYYEKGETKLPVIMGMGEGAVAQRMIEIAKQEGIPIMQNVPLARELYESGQVDQYIPSELIEPVAEVLRWVRQLQAEQE